MRILFVFSRADSYPALSPHPRPAFFLLESTGEQKIFFSLFFPENVEWERGENGRLFGGKRIGFVVEEEERKKYYFSPPVKTEMEKEERKRGMNGGEKKKGEKRMRGFRD